MEIRTAMQNTERETTEDLRRVFNLFLDDPNATTTSLQPIKKWLKNWEKILINSNWEQC